MVHGQMRSVIDWGSVRNIGELKILAKASSIGLVVIPVIAFIWPSFVGEIAEDIRRAVLSIESPFEGFTSQIDRVCDAPNYKRLGTEQALGCEELSAYVDEINDGLEVILRKVDDILHLVSDNARLPFSIGILFFSSLSILIAQVIYHVAAPDDVKVESHDKYVHRAKEEFVFSPSDKFVDLAVGVLEEAGDVMVKPESGVYQDDASYERELLNWKVDVVGRFASKRYIELCLENPFSRYLSAAFYFSGVVMIGVVLLYQAYRIVLAMGWL